ncbi:DUF1801 domain-containing protein [Fulvivirgaceae bacterium PWU20]|uniref:DUF1801 domain-containing protein n=1 Tax=Chryseosolibacter indicus TaxID=2782351 RepID=A0ABS5VZ50_9BACT|nr:DUF1801 domain-containing protein [Chryseosolibacter indicus]
MKETNEVNDFLDNLEHPLMPIILKLRSVILTSDKKLTEHIKWNAPSFCINGDDRITMKLFPPKNVQIIFHRGAKVKAQPKEKLIDDITGLLKWVTNDRAVATFTSLEEVESKASDLKVIVKKWIEFAL